jgi:hypothetical protein
MFIVQATRAVKRRHDTQRIDIYSIMTPSVNYKNSTLGITTPNAEAECQGAVKALQSTQNAKSKNELSDMMSQSRPL